MLRICVTLLLLLRVGGVQGMKGPMYNGTGPVHLSAAVYTGFDHSGLADVINCNITSFYNSGPAKLKSCNIRELENSGPLELCMQTEVKKALGAGSTELYFGSKIHNCVRTGPVKVYNSVIDNLNVYNNNSLSSNVNYNNNENGPILDAYNSTTSNIEVFGAVSYLRIMSPQQQVHINFQNNKESDQNIVATNASGLLSVKNGVVRNV